jgi:hypothetical protein
MTRAHCLSFECSDLVPDEEGYDLKGPGLKQIREPRLDVFSSAGKNTGEGEMRITYESLTSTSISNERKHSWSLTVGVNASIKAGIPLLAEAGLEISGEVSGSGEYATGKQRVRVETASWA